MKSMKPSEKEVLNYFKRLSNWGRWGKDDELGTINFITPEKILEALKLAGEGETVNLSRPISTGVRPDMKSEVLRLMVDSGEGRNTDTTERLHQRMGAVEFIGMIFHGTSITHIDSPAHYFWQGKMYNNRPAKLVSSREGVQANSVENLRDGVITRGILLDLVNRHSSHEAVLPRDLEAAEKRGKVKVEKGNVVLLRTRGRRPPHVAVAPWLFEREVAIWGSDTTNDLSPSPYQKIPFPFHTVSLVAMGLWLLDNCDLEELARACAKRKRWEFLFLLIPLRLKNTTGSPVNPIAVF